MAFDYVVDLPCSPKLSHGSNDRLAGTEKIMEFVKAKNRAAALEELARRNNQPLSDARAKIGLITQDGRTVQGEYSHAQLEEMASPLKAMAPQCEACPVNFLISPAGCYGAINYPVAAPIESWVTQHLMPAATFGGQLCLDFMAEFHCTGSHTAEMRSHGFFQSRACLSATLKKGLFTSQRVTTDQFFDAVFAAGNPLQPAHCFGILIWLGCVLVDGQPIAGPTQLQALETLAKCTDRKAKKEHISLNLGARDAQNVAVQIQDLLHAMFLAWQEDVPLLVST